MNATTAVTTQVWYRGKEMPMHRRVRVLLAAVATGAVMSVSACGALIAGDGGGKGRSLNYWSMWSEGEPQQKVLAAALDSFSKETGIKVNVQWVGRDNIKKVAPTLNAARSPVDLVDAAQRNIKSIIVTTDAYLPLDDVYGGKVAGEDKTVGRVIPERYSSTLRSGGKAWMVPYELVTSAFWYNEAKHPELAAQPPRTWDDLIVTLDKIKKTGRAPLALDGDIANFNLYYFAELAVRDLGAGKLHEAVADKSGQALKAPAILQAAQRVQALAKGGYFADGYASSKWPAMQRKWAQNSADLIYNGTWLPSETSEYSANGFKYRAFPMPTTNTGGDRSQDVSFIGFAIPKKSPNTDAAKKFIAYFMNKERLAGIATIAKNLTPRPDIAAPAELADAKQMVESAPAVHRQFDGIEDDYGDWTNKVLIPLVNSLTFGRLTADKFVTTLARNSAKYWKDHG